MENKGLSLVTVICIIIIFIAILCMGGYLIYNNNLKISELEETIAKQKINEEENLKNNVNNITNNIQSETKEFIAPSLFTAKAKKTATDMEYGISFEKNDFGVRIENGRPYMYTSMEKEICAQIANVTIDQVKIGKRQEQEVTGFTKNVVEVHIGVIGQNNLSTFIFLMEDGTVEYSTIKNMITNVSTEGKIEGLNNIIKLQDVYVSDIPDENGVGGEYSSIIAIDKDNNYYDLNQCF